MHERIIKMERGPKFKNIQLTLEMIKQRGQGRYILG